ncbi:MAG: helix-turn-helix domain-containing protein [Clostridia bacterium]|nr:helix-turn-helix domain-containing protein [Clostridia bacterium]
MNENKQANYYAIIPATIRYDNELKPSEKLLYGEITALSNKEGYCFATNKYFASLYGVINGTVSRWISHLEQSDYIRIELIKNDKNQIIERRLYLTDTYKQFCLYPYEQKETYPISKKAKYNNININKMIDDLFILIINKSNSIPEDFYEVLNKLELLYDNYTISYISTENQTMIKNIYYVLLELYNSKFDYLLEEFSRESLLNLYRICQDYKTDDFLQYYKRTLINKYTNNST